MTLESRSERRIVKRALRNNIGLSTSSHGTGTMKDVTKKRYKVSSCMSSGNAAAQLAAHRAIRADSDKINGYISGTQIVAARGSICQFFRTNCNMTSNTVYKAEPTNLYEAILRVENKYELAK